MDTLDETERCGPSRELVRKFLPMSPQERDAMGDGEKKEMALAFQHIEMCVQGNEMPELCNRLWQNLQPIIRPTKEGGLENEDYDPQVARYMLFAQFPFHDEPGTEDNPLKKLTG